MTPGRLLRAAVVLASVASGPFAAPARAAEALDAGRAVYEEHCLGCHGATGGGDGEVARRLGFRPRDFRWGAFKCRCTPSGELPTDDDLLRAVTDGLPGTPMRRFGSVLSEAERRSVVDYVKSLTPAFAERTAPACIEIPEPPAASPAAVAEGRQIYRLLRCWTCHGVEGTGDGPAAAALRDDWGEPIKAYDFTRPRRFKCGGEARDLYRLLHTGMAGSPMPSFSTALGFASDGVGDLAPLAKTLGRVAVDELAAYLASQPDRAALSALGEAELRELVDRRTWALAHFLRSLSVAR